MCNHLSQATISHDRSPIQTTEIFQKPLVRTFRQRTSPIQNTEIFPKPLVRNFRQRPSLVSDYLPWPITDPEHWNFPTASS